MSSPLLRGFGTFAAGCITSLLLVLPSIAPAASSKYPPDAAARGFNGGLAGWTASSSFDGTCQPPLLCPSVTNSHQPSDGADGGGYVRSAYQGVAGAMAVGGTTTAVWQSPGFTYGGVDGAVPAAISFEMDRRASVDQLLAAAGNSATYSVRLVDVSAGGETITLIAPTSLAEAKTWKNAPVARVDPDRLVLGRDYRILVTTTYVTGTSVLVTGSADYDNVLLRASDGRAGSGNGNGPSASAARRLLGLLRDATPGSATLKGKRLLVRVACPNEVDGRTCRITAQGLLRKGRPATTRRTVTVPRGRTKLVALLVKPKARSAVDKRKRLLVRHKVRVGQVSAILYKKRKLIRR